MDFSQLLNILWRKKWIILGATLGAAAIAALFSFLQPNFYSSKAQYSTGIGAQKISLSGNQGGGWTETEIGINNVIATFKSPTILGNVAYRLMLEEIQRNKNTVSRQSFSDPDKQALINFVYNDSTASVLRNKLSKQEILDPTNPYEKKLLEALQLFGYGYEDMSSAIRINRIPGTDYIDVVYRSKDPNISAMVVNTVGIEYLRFYETLSSQRGKQTADTIASFMQTQQKKVDSLTNLLIDEKRRQGAVNPEQISNLAVQTLTNLQQRLTEEKARYNTASSTFQSLKNQLQVLQGNVAGNVGASEEVIRLQSRKRELIAMMNDRGQDPELRSQIDEINRKIAASTGSPTTTRRKEKIDDLNLQMAEQEGIIQASSKTITDLESQIRNVSGKTNLGAGNDIKMTALWSSLDIENRQLVQIKDKYIQAQGLLKEVPNVNFRQTLIGQPSTQPDDKRSVLNMSLAGTSAFLLSSFFFLIGILMDKSVGNPSNFRNISSARVAGIVNKLSKFPESINDVFSKSEVLNNELDHFRESIRKIRFELDTQRKKKILVTSLKKGTGKTTIIQSLSQSLKLSRKKVLILDANFNNNSLTQAFHAQNFLEDTAKLHPQSEAVRKVVTKTEDPFIDVIGCRGGLYTPSEVLPDNNILAHLDEIFPEYDYIIMEGPSLHPHSDSQELVKYADGVLCVVSASEKVYPNDVRMLEYMESLGGKLIGVILNEVRLEDTEH